MIASNVKNVSLSSIDVLAEVALRENYITEKELQMVNAFIAAPDFDAWQNIG